METEIEAKFLDVDPESLRRRLQEIGAALIHSERLMRRWNFDYPDKRLQKIGGWVRVRDEGDKITLAYKCVSDFHSIHGTAEVALEVDDTNRARSFLQAIGLEPYSYQETKRERWSLDGVEVALDTWPWIPAFVEVEGADEDAVRSVTRKLGLPWNQALFGSVEGAYKRYFDVTDEEIDNWEAITFVATPQWLAAKRKPGPKR